MGTFSPFDNEQLAVGDNDGNLRILQIPQNLTIPLNRERKLMAHFYKNEAVRIEFILKRMNEQKTKSIKEEQEREEDEQKEKEKEEERGRNGGEEEKNDLNDDDNQQRLQ